MNFIQEVEYDLEYIIVVNPKLTHRYIARVSHSERLIEYSPVLLEYSETFQRFSFYQLFYLGQHKDLKRADREAIEKLIEIVPDFDKQLFVKEFTKALSKTLSPLNLERIADVTRYFEQYNYPKEIEK